jgi:hypothetical protein
VAWGAGEQKRHDDEILQEFQAAFPEMATNQDGKLQKIDEAMMKSPEGKEAWRKYIKLFENTGPSPSLPPSIHPSIHPLAQNPRRKADLAVSW